MRPITIVGAGGIGCAVGHALCAAGVPVSFVDANAAKVEWGRAHGVGIELAQPWRQVFNLPGRLDGKLETCRHKAEFVHFSDWQPKSDAFILLCTKCYSNAQVLERVPASATLLPIQNGFDERLEEFGHEWEGIASFVSECAAERTLTRITRAGRLHLGVRGGEGEKGSGADDGLQWLGGVLKRHAAFRVAVVADILPYKYTKLMYNAAVGPLASAAGIDNGGLLWRRELRRLFFALLLENYRILKAAGVELARIGPFHPDTVARILERRVVAHALAWAFYPSLRGTYCSMAGDLPLGRTEIDNYNGHLIRLAGGRGCELNQRVLDLVRRMERERLGVGMERVEELMGEVGRRQNRGTENGE